jgi:prepilin-type N-terminal cleavage/methylation domain-containing protein
MLNRKAFTMIEILATITISSVLITPIFYLMNTGSRGVYKSADKTYALIMATDILELVKGIDFEAMPPREEPYNFAEIQQIVSSRPRKELFFNRLYLMGNDQEQGEVKFIDQNYGRKFLVGIYIQRVDFEDPMEVGKKQKELRRATVVIQWKSVLGKDKTDTVRLHSFYTEHKSD